MNSFGAVNKVLKEWLTPLTSTYLAFLSKNIFQKKNLRLLGFPFSKLSWIELTYIYFFNIIQNSFRNGQNELFFGRLIASGSAVNQHQNKQTIRPRWVQQIIKREKGGENEKKAVIPSEVAQEFSLLFSWTFPLCKSGLMRTKSFLSRVEDIKFKKKEEALVVVGKAGKSIRRRRSSLQGSFPVLNRGKPQEQLRHGGQRPNQNQTMDTHNSTYYSTLSW